MKRDTQFETSAAANLIAQEPVIDQIALSEIPETAPTGPSLLGTNLDLIRGVKVKLFAHIGSVEISIGELYSLKDGSVLHLDRMTSDPIDIVLNGHVVARGTIVAADDCFGIQITELPHISAQATP